MNDKALMQKNSKKQIKINIGQRGAFDQPSTTNDTQNQGMLKLVPRFYTQREASEKKS